MANHTNSWLYCEHANESPARCPCAVDCICRTQGHCRSQPPPIEDEVWRQASSAPEHHRHVSLFDLFETARQHVESRLGHSLLKAEDAYQRTFGFSCSTCRSTFMMSSEDYRTWISQSPPEHRSLFIYNREYLLNLLNTPAPLTFGMEPLILSVDTESRRTSYQRLMENEEE